MDGLIHGKTYWFQHGCTAFWSKMLVLTWLDLFMVKILVSAWLQCVVVKDVGFSMDGLSFGET
jgi:hypothetical protein